MCCVWGDISIEIKRLVWVAIWLCSWMVWCRPVGKSPLLDVFKWASWVDPHGVDPETKMWVQVFGILESQGNGKARWGDTGSRGRRVPEQVPVWVETGSHWEPLSLAWVGHASESTHLGDAEAISLSSIWYPRSTYLPRTVLYYWGVLPGRWPL